MSTDTPNNQTTANKALYEVIEGDSLETALSKLEHIVSLLEAEKIDLESAITYYDIACQLQTYCQQKLEQAQLKIELIVQKNGQILGTEKLQP